MTGKVLLFIWCFSFTAAAQVSGVATTPLKVSRWQLGISASADYDYRTYKSRDGDETTKQFISLRNDKEKAKAGYSGGLNIRYQFSNKLRLGGGVHYANRGYQIKPVDITDFDPLTGYGKVIATVYSVYSYHYLEVPLSIDWCFYKRGKFNLYASGGIIPGFLLSASSKSHFSYNNGANEIKSARDNTAYNTISLTPTVALGANYKLTPHSVISITPTFRHSVVALIDAPIQAFLWSGGLSVGYCRSM